jgi:ribose transport system ATP-binding protein
MTGIVKEFPGVRALDGVNLDVLPGEVHCLLGQNGAGKSTLIKVLAGAHHPNEGTIVWDGAEVRLPNPTAAIQRGIATIYQELDLVEGMTVAENISLGNEKTSFGFNRRSDDQARAAALLDRLGHGDIDPTAVVDTLSAAGKQIVSMARALSLDARLIVMDEPSAVLDQQEVQRLFGVIRDLTSDGVAVIYISHRLEEIRDIGDRVTVLKDGRTVANGLAASDTPTSEVVRLMTGREMEYDFPPRRAPIADADPVLVVEGMGRDREFSDISLRVRPGEIVGLAGLVGAGRSEVLETIFGARRRQRGTVTVAGNELGAGSVPAAVRAGVGLCPEERKSQALILAESVTRNISVASLSRYSRGGWLRRGEEQSDAAEQMTRLDIRADSADREVRTLSGGNQQKVVLARWLLKGCAVLLLDEPTRGVDVGARSEIYRLIRELADSGVAIVLVSSEVPEVLGLADHVLVMKDGAVRHAGPAHEIDEARVLELVMEGTPR